MRLRLACLLFTLMMSLRAGAVSIPLSLDSKQIHHLQMQETAPGTLAITTTGGDPYVVAQVLPEGLASDSGSVLSFEYFCPDGVDGLEVYYALIKGPWRSVNGGAMGRAETWQPVAVNLRSLSQGKWNGEARRYRLDFGTKAGVKLQIRNVQLREPNALELQNAMAVEAERSRKADLSKAATAYMNAEYASQISVVAVGGEEIKITGSANAQPGETLFLAELKMDREPWGSAPLSPVTSALTGAFERTLPRFEGGEDRLFSRWCVITENTSGEYRLASHAVHPTDIAGIATSVIPQLSARTKKGMGGVVLNPIAGELKEMGVEHVTVNVVLNSFFRVQPAAGTRPYVFEGKTYAVSNAVVAGMDKSFQFFSKSSVVSAIILVGFPKDAVERAAMVHPEAQSPGVYGMPNFTTPEGVHAYRAALAFLAERYSTRESGVITNWILHNEVDFAWSWTNMGEQPMNVFMDHYVRSLRIAYYTARRFNPAAKVFISLTHNWCAAEGSVGKNYRTRDMVDLLAEYSRLEGDFEWGMAYHPYPQSLFHAATWNDKKVDYTFNTELITPKNIEVLDAYMHQPRLRYQGKVLRSVLLSEQGYHTPDMSEASERLQAAALVYTWHKIRPLESIVAFHNHRWMDAAGEGGLLLGLRRLPTPEDPFGAKKIGWAVYQALDTPQEAEATAFAKEIIGVRDFAEIPYRGAIQTE
jgi:hypothetical protein